MPKRMREIFCILSFTMLSTSIARGQSPPPIVVQAASPAAAAAATISTVREQDSSSVEAEIKLLEQVKAKNEEMLRKQEAALQQLDEMQQAAEQLKVFSKRG
jgi:flagellar basal body rod protein FlgF